VIGADQAEGEALAAIGELRRRNFAWFKTKDLTGEGGGCAGGHLAGRRFAPLWRKLQTRPILEGSAPPNPDIRRGWRTASLTVGEIGAQSTAFRLLRV
jgi:hypothetical protein